MPRAPRTDPNRFDPLPPAHADALVADAAEVARTVAAAVSAHRNQIPLTGAALAADIGVSVPRATALLASPRVVAALEARGVTATPLEPLTPHQLAAAAIYLDTSSRMRHAQRLAAAGVSEAQWQGWMRNPRFASFLADAGMDALQASVPRALAVTAEKADDGERWAVELTLAITGVYDPRKQDEALGPILGMIFEVLETSDVPADVLARIGTRIRDRLSGAALPSAARGAAPIVAAPAPAPAVTPTVASASVAESAALVADARPLIDRRDEPPTATMTP